MKKILMTAGLLCGLMFASGRLRAATPQDQYFIGESGVSNTTIYGSSTPVSSAANASITFPVVSNNSGGGSKNARNCITDFTVQMSTYSTMYILDGATTGYTLIGADMLQYSGQVMVTKTVHYDHLAPWCGTSGNTLQIYVPAPTPNIANQSISVDGYTTFGINSILNGGQ